MSTEPESLQNDFDRAFVGIRQVRDEFTPALTPREVGTVTSVATGIAKVSGLPGVGFDELVTFPGDLLGIAFNVDEHEIGVVVLDESSRLHVGDEVLRTGRVMDVGVGEGLLGRVIDPLGRPLDGKGPVHLASVCPSSAERRASWTARPSRYLFKPASSSSTRLSPWDAASAS
jgi:F-type H+/Na+-transporting ATPase subunit alpha